jgi:anti-sigma regulatory factor (Ser/Thr protein kinase)
VNSSAPLWQRTSRVTREIWLAADLAAPRHARAFVPGVLADWGLGRLRQDAELVASELVTNALRVARGKVRVRLVLLDCSMILEVWDPAVALPSVPLAAAPDSECGRGMLIVETLSAQWSTYCAAEGGKWVWAELR